MQILLITVFLYQAFRPLRHWLLLVYFFIAEIIFYAFYGVVLDINSEIVFYLLISHLISINITAIIGYKQDKEAARKKKYRIPEATFHTLTLLGAAPGAIFAQKTFRHKTRKKYFRSTQVAVIAVQLLLIVLFGMHLI